jgi:flagellar biogenesis protein FliO
MGAPLQDQSVPAARVEIPAELLRDQAPVRSARLEELKQAEHRKIGREGAPEPGLGGALGATLVVVALLLGAFLLLRKFLGRTRLFAPAAALRVLARRPLAARQEVILVEVGSRILVVGATRESLSRLGEITGAEEIAAVRSRCGAAPAEAPAPRPARADAEPAPAPSYDGVLEELTKIRTTVRDWSRQEATP